MSKQDDMHLLRDFVQTTEKEIDFFKDFSRFSLVISDHRSVFDETQHTRTLARMTTIISSPQTPEMVKEWARTVEKVYTKIRCYNVTPDFVTPDIVLPSAQVLKLPRWTLLPLWPLQQC